MKISLISVYSLAIFSFIGVHAMANPVFAHHGSIEAQKDEQVSGDLNDYKSGGVAPFTFALEKVGPNIAATVQPNGAFTITPNAGFIGRSVLYFTVTDSAGSTSNGTISIRTLPATQRTAR